MKIRNFLLAATMIAGIANMEGTDVKQPDSYAYTRGMECMNEGKYEDAMDWMQKEISDHPDNGYAYFIISTIHIANNQNGSALSAINNAIKKIPSKDKVWSSAAMGVRADINLALKDTVKAFEDIARGLKIQSDNTSLLKSRAQIYYELEKYDLSDADYKEMIKIDPGDTMGYMGVGRNENAREDWDKAIAMFDKVINLSPEYSQGYSFRADAYIGKKDWAKATDDIVKALDIDGDQKAFYLMNNIDDEAYSMLKTKLKIMKAKQPSNRYWPYCLAKLSTNHQAYSEAIKYYNEAHNLDANSVFLEDIAKCYAMMKDYDNALQYAQRAIYLDNEDYDLVDLKADILSDMQRYDECIAERDKYVERYPDNPLSYINRAEDLMNAHRFGDALEDFNTSYVIEPRLLESTYFLMKRGDANRLSGNQADAEADYRKIIEIEKDSVPGNDSWIAFAYSALGNADKAIETATYVLDNDTTDISDNLYNLACIYSRLGMKQDAVKYFAKAVDAGYDNYVHAREDYDLDLIREMEEFQNIMNTLEEMARPSATENEIVSEDEATYEKVEVPFTKEGGVTKVKCKINELPLHFVFDTGAADVTMSMVEANFMFKNDYIKPSDIIGSARYMDANGDISEGTIVNLRKVDFGGLELDNVRASVVRNQKAPLLLGQSVLGRLGKIEIDNPGQKLIISHKVNKR
ncbi:MAG: retroviral-like aspartic protease family protein [Muribaculaceae bacterium]|nr:retroviral-like aspartic protease family protein [Muribaculaceae bacterium]